MPDSPIFEVRERIDRLIGAWGGGTITLVLDFKRGSANDVSLVTVVLIRLQPNTDFNGLGTLVVMAYKVVMIYQYYPQRYKYKCYSPGLLVSIFARSWSRSPSLTLFVHICPILSSLLLGCLSFGPLYCRHGGKTFLSVSSRRSRSRGCRS